MKRSMKQCPSFTLGYGIKRTPIVLGLSAALCMPAVFSYANVGGGMDGESIQSVMQGRTIKGQILDETGESMIGVSVLVKGTTIGTVTDFDGNYTLEVPAGKNILEISYIGYKTKEITIGNNSRINVKMDPDTQALDEVVVIGYGAVKKRDLTGAVVSVKSDDITLNPNSNPMQALQGRVAGLDITKESGQAGSEIKMQLRGTRSFTAKGNPTFIIDGMPGDYSTLNPNDIESIEVLKDASSTAVYGSAGANGVVIITTKSGQAGKMKVDFNAYAGINGWSTLPEMRSGDSYLQVIRDANAATGNWTSAADDERVMDGLLGEGAYAAHQRGEYIDWAKELMQTAVTQNYSLAFSGGTEKTKAYVSFNFSDENGQYKNDNYKVYSSNIRVDHQVRKWMNVGVNTQMSYVHQNKAYANLDAALRMEPLGTTHDENGNMNVQPSLGGSNINLLLNNNGNYRNQNQNYKLYFNPYIEIKPLKGLSILSRLGATLNYNRTNYFQGLGSYQYYNQSGADASGTNQNVYAQITQRRNYNYKWENIITYNFQINRDHDFTVTAVTSWNHNQNDETVQKETHITDNAYLWHNMGKSGDDKSHVSSLYQMSRGMGYIGRLSYSYKGRYLASASVRQDGSSRLADGHKWDTYPAFSLGWRISDEKFMEGTRNWMDNLKLRGGYGVTGTASIDPYSSVSNLEQSSLSFSNQSMNIYRYAELYANKALGWEKSYNTNIGVDVSFLNNRIDFTADFYWTKTKGVIWKRSLPITNGGYTSTTNYSMNMNICETKNSGMEFALNTRNIDTKDFKWNSTLTFTNSKEKIVSLIDGVANNITNGDYALTIGEAVNSYYNYKIDGMWQKGEEADAAVFGCEPGSIKINVPGMVKEADGKFYKIDEKGEKVYYTADSKYAYSDKDYQTLGKNSPDWTMGFQNTFTYKNFDLSVFMYMRWGQMIKYGMLGSYDPSGKANFPTYFNYWTENNPSNDFPAIKADQALTGYTGYYALQYVDGSFFKIKNITLGYTLPQNVLSKLGMTKCRFYATVTNPLTVAKSHLLKDYDPEMNGKLDYPLTKQLVFGVNVSF